MLGIAAFGVLKILYHYFFQEDWNFRQTFDRHAPTTVVTLIALVFGFQIWLIGLLADLMAAGRRITEEVLYRTRRMELELSELRERGQMLVDHADHADGVDHVEHLGSPANGATHVVAHPAGATAVQDGSVGSVTEATPKEGQHAKEPISEGAARQVR